MLAKGPAEDDVGCGNAAGRDEALTDIVMDRCVRQRADQIANDDKDRA
jgi:hypothetical protein